MPLEEEQQPEESADGQGLARYWRMAKAWHLTFSSDDAHPYITKYRTKARNALKRDRERRGTLASAATRYSSFAGSFVHCTGFKSATYCNPAPTLVSENVVLHHFPKVYEVESIPNYLKAELGVYPAIVVSFVENKEFNVYAGRFEFAKQGDWEAAEIGDADKTTIAHYQYSMVDKEDQFDSNDLYNFVFQRKAELARKPRIDGKRPVMLFHCKAGVGRSFVAAVIEDMIETQDHPDDIVARIRRRRTGASYTPERRKILIDLFEKKFPDAAHKREQQISRRYQFFNRRSQSLPCLTHCLPSPDERTRRRALSEPPQRPVELVTFGPNTASDADETTQANVRKSPLASHS